MAEHQVESVPFGYVSTAKQATFQVALRFVRQMRRAGLPGQQSNTNQQISFRNR